MSVNCNCCDDSPICIEFVTRHGVSKAANAIAERRLDKAFIECDGCWKDFPSDNLPRDSFQTYNGEWFCSEECGKKGGW